MDDAPNVAYLELLLAVIGYDRVRLRMIYTMRGCYTLLPCPRRSQYSSITTYLLKSPSLHSFKLYICDAVLLHARLPLLLPHRSAGTEYLHHCVSIVRIKRT
jgi:hypothetical protein